MGDRTVHGTGTDYAGRCYEIVRYDRAGRWAQEFIGGSGLTVGLRLADAVRLAQVPLLGRPGGLRFDAKVREAR